MASPKKYLVKKFVVGVKVSKKDTALQSRQCDSLVEPRRLADDVGWRGEILVQVALGGGVDNVGGQAVVLGQGEDPVTSELDLMNKLPLTEDRPQHLLPKNYFRT
jgi:hypothetical protein